MIEKMYTSYKCSNNFLRKCVFDFNELIIFFNYLLRNQIKIYTLSVYQKNWSDAIKNEIRFFNSINITILWFNHLFTTLKVTHLYQVKTNKMTRLIFETNAPATIIPNDFLSKGVKVLSNSLGKKLLVSIVWQYIFIISKFWKPSSIKYKYVSITFSFYIINTFQINIRSYFILKCI